MMRLGKRLDGLLAIIRRLHRDIGEGGLDGRREHILQRGFVLRHNQLLRVTVLEFRNGRSAGPVRAGFCVPFFFQSRLFPEIRHDRCDVVELLPVFAVLVEFGHARQNLQRIVELVEKRG